MFWKITPAMMKVVISYLIYKSGFKKQQSKQLLEMKRFIDEAQWWETEKIKKWQLNKIKEIVKYAYENVVGYKQLYNENNVNHNDINSLDDIKLFPFVTKEMLRDNLRDFTSKAIPKWKKCYVTTAGSTGIPFGFYLSLSNFEIEDAFMYSGWERVGWRFNDSSAVLRGGYIGSEKIFWDYNYYRNELRLSSYFLSKKTYKEYLAKIKEFKPLHLQAYPSGATVMADLILEHQDFDKINFKTILLGSENIYNWQRKKIRLAFPKAKIFSWYGHAEQVILAAECEYSDHYHLWPFYGYTEILNNNQEANEGEVGEIVGTSFWNLVTPMIRYKTMDYAKRGRLGCEKCGRQFLTLQAIEGRLQEMIISKTGRYISMTAINMHDNTFDELQQFQFLQNEPGKVVFKYLPKKVLSEIELLIIKKRLLKKLGNDIELTLVQVDKIATYKSRKYRFLDQKLNLKYGDL